MSMIGAIIIMTSVLIQVLVQSHSSNAFVYPTPFLASRRNNIDCDLKRQQSPFLEQLSCTSRCINNLHQRRHSLIQGYLSQSDDDEFVEAEDLEALQSLFSKYCDNDGLMTKKAVMKVPAIAELLEDDDLRPEEFTDIWERAPKFPDAEEKKGERIDVDSFVQIYRDIDDLFEDEYEDDGKKKDDQTPTTKDNTAVASKKEETLESTDSENESDNEELQMTFKEICGTISGSLSKTDLRSWDEIEKLIKEGLLGKNEFDELWENAIKSSSQKDKIDLDGFVKFNNDLDELFDFEEDEESDDGASDDKSGLESSNDSDNADDEEIKTDSEAPLRMIQGEGLEPDILFVSLANEDGLVGLDELKRWADLQEMIKDGDLLESELMELFKAAKKSEMDLNKLEEDGFIELYKAIDDLFEIDEEEDEESSAPQTISVKTELLNAIASLQEDDLLPCGLDADERDQKEILSIIQDVEREPTNMIRLKQGAIELKDLSGTWELIYTSSSAMKFNKGLSGLGGSFPNGRFESLRQKLTASKFLADVEYIERIEVNPSSASFDVTVTGTWDLRTSVSLFTGEPSIVMTVEPDRVSYGPTSTRADHWKSLGPMNMLDITYLDDEIRIMRGNTSVDTVFVFRRID